MHCIYENANIPVQQCVLQEVINLNIFGTMPFPSTTFYRKATFSFAKLSHVPRQNALSMVTNMKYALLYSLAGLLELKATVTLS